MNMIRPGLADELAGLAVEVIVHMRKTVARQDLRVGEIGDIDYPPETRRAVGWIDDFVREYEQRGMLVLGDDQRSGGVRRPKIATVERRNVIQARKNRWIVWIAYIH